MNKITITLAANGATLKVTRESGRTYMDLAGDTTIAQRKAVDELRPQNLDPKVALSLLYPIFYK